MFCNTAARDEDHHLDSADAIGRCCNRLFLSLHIVNYLLADQGARKLRCPCMCHCHCLIIVGNDQRS